MYLVGGAPLTEPARLWCAVLATGGVLGSSTALALWEPSEIEPTGLVHVIVDRAVRRRSLPPWIQLTRCDLPTSAVR